MTELEGHDGHDSYAYVQLRAASNDLVHASKRIRELEGTVDALGELASDMARDLEDAPLGAWYADRLRKLGIGGR